MAAVRLKPCLHLGPRRVPEAFPKANIANSSPSAYLRHAFGMIGNPSASLLDAFRTDSGSKYLRHWNFKSFESLIRDSFGVLHKPSATPPQPFRVIRKFSGSLRGPIRSRLRLQHRFGMLREAFGVWPATLRQPFRIYMPRTCGIHAEYTPNGSFVHLDPEGLPKLAIFVRERFGNPSGY